MVAGERGLGWGRAEGTAGWHDHGHGLRGWGGEHSGCVGQTVFGTLSTVTKTHPTLSYLHPNPHFPAPTAPAPVIGFENGRLSHTRENHCFYNNWGHLPGTEVWALISFNPGNSTTRWAV